MALQSSVNSSYQSLTNPLELKSSSYLWLNGSFGYLSKGGVGCAIDAQETVASSICSFRLNSGSPTGLNQLAFSIGDASTLPNGCFLNIFRGNGTTTINHQLSGNSNSYLCAAIGNLGIGTASPLDKLHVFGTIRAASLRMGGNSNEHTWGAAAPTTGTWKRGDVCWNTTPSASTAMITNYVGWACVTAGTPGTWKGFGAITV